jgi:hypothetical protein
VISVFLRDFVALWGRAGFQYLYIKISVCWPCLPRQTILCLDEWILGPLVNRSNFIRGILKDEILACVET